MADVVVEEHWWNGAWGKLARYDIWLLRCPDPEGRDRWRIRTQRGGSESRDWHSGIYTDEAAARAHVAHVKDIRANDRDPKFEWRDMKRISTTR